MTQSVEDNSGDVFASIGDLHREKYAREIIDSHYSVIEYWTPENTKRELCYDWRKGKHFTEDEEKQMREQGKAPIVINKAISTIRSVLGTFVLNKYDVTPAPVEPSDQDITEPLKARYKFHHYNQNCKMKDKSLMEKSLIAGDAWQESYMIITPGDKPRMVVQNQNDFAIYPDPNSIDLIDRRDCEFIDRDSWMTTRELISAFPEKKGRIMEALSQQKENENENYENEKRYANRLHETEDWKNGKYRVTERFYKVLKNKMWGVNGQDRIELGEDPEVDSLNNFQKDFPEYTLQKKPIEYLYIAIVCDQYSYEEFLYNGPYHCQPRNPVTQEIMFPLVQLYCEEVAGTTNGIIEYQIGPNKLIDAIISQELYNIQHEVNTALVGNPDKFDENGKEDIEQHHAQGDRMFWVKAGQTIEGAVTQLPQTVNTTRNETMINWTSQFQDEVSATNPSQKGMSEGSGIAARLDQQRTERAETQQVSMVENYRHFLVQRARLWASYDRKYVTEEETFRMLEKENPGDPEWLTINKTEVDVYGSISKSNDISSAIYDYRFEDSVQSPSMRSKIMAQIVQLKQNMGQNVDPRTSAYLDAYYLKMADVDQKLKDFMYKNNKMIQDDQAQMRAQQAQAQQQEMEKQKGEMDLNELSKKGKQLENDKLMQELAQLEAEQTTSLDEQIANPIEQAILAR